MKLTAIIPTGNEEHNIKDVIASVQFADEIMVVDSFSTDNTLNIAKQYTDFVVRREYINSASQKNWAIPQANNEWILLVDADERVSEDLKNEILNTLKNNPEEVAFWIGRSNDFMGKRIKYSGWQGDKVIRLFRKSKCTYENKEVHAEIIANGKVGKLKHKLIHNTYVSLDHYIDKLNRYAWWQAKDLQKKGIKITPYHLLIKPIYRFVKHYIIGKGFLDGIPGFAIAVLEAYAVGSRYLKLWLLNRNLE